MSARKRKGRNINHRERTVTTFTEDPNTSLLVPLASEEPAPFAMYQNYMPPQQPQFYQHVLPPGKDDLEILENLKSMIKEGQHEFYRAIPQPAALASLYMGPMPHPDHEYPSPRFSHDSSVDIANGPDMAQSTHNIVEAHPPHSPGADTSPSKTSAETLDIPDASAQPEPQESQPPPADTMSDVAATSPNPDTAKDDNTDDKKTHFEDHNTPARATSRPSNGTASDTRIPPPEDTRFDRDRDRDRITDRDREWERDRARHDSIRDRARDRRPEFFGRSYGRSHAPRPPPELRHYEPSYGADYVPPPRRFDPDDRRGGLRSAPLDDRLKPPPLDDKRPSYDALRPSPATADERRLNPDRPIRPGSDARPLFQPSEDRDRPASEAVPPTRAAIEDDRPLVADDRPRAMVPLEERLSQPASVPSLQDRLSQPVVPARMDIPTAPSLEERLSSGPARAYPRAPSVARDDHRAPLPKDDPRDHDRITDFRANRDFSRERPGAPPRTTSTYRSDLDRSFGNRDERDRRDRDVVDAPPRFGDAFSRVGPLPQRRFSPPPPMLDRDREQDRARPYYPPRSPPPFRGEGAYNPDGDRRYTNDRERDAHEQRRRDWYGSGDDDKRGPLAPPSAPWRPREGPPFMDRDRERLDRERERERDIRERDRERDRDLGGLPPPPPPPTRAHWDERERRFPPSPPLSRMDAGNGGPNRSLSARLTDPYPPPLSGERGYPPPREFDRGRYGAPGLDDRTHAPPLPRVRNRSASPPRRGLGLADDMRPPPLKRLREDGGPVYAGPGGVGPAYSPPRRGEYAPGPPPSSSATAATSIGTVPPRSAGARTPPPGSGTNGAFYDREREKEREREREYMRGAYGMGYERDRGRRSPPLMGRVGSGYGRGVRDDRDRRYVG